MRITRKIRENKPLSITHQFISSPSSRFLLILTCCLGLGLSANHVMATIPETKPVEKIVLNPGMRGVEIQVLQMQLKALGYYQGIIDGDYGESTQNAVAKFQQAKALNREDGIADLTTQYFINQTMSGKNEVTTSPTPTPQPTINLNAVNTANISQPENQQKSFIWWSLLGIGILAITGSILFLIKRLTKTKNYPQVIKPKLLNSSPENKERKFLKSAEIEQKTIPTDLVQLETKPFMSHLSICEELMQELQSDNSKKRRKAIWKLAQDGDSRAVKPLVDLMIDTDSEQQSLILATLAEIGTRTLKPINRALIISMRDENPQVRKNAIRDLVRIYDMMGKMSKIVLHALEDPDPEVQETARYALNQMNRIRSVPDQQILSDMSTEET